MVEAHARLASRTRCWSAVRPVIAAVVVAVALVALVPPSDPERARLRPEPPEPAFLAGVRAEPHRRGWWSTPSSPGPSPTAGSCPSSQRLVQRPPDDAPRDRRRHGCRSPRRPGRAVHRRPPATAELRRGRRGPALRRGGGRRGGRPRVAGRPRHRRLRGRRPSTTGASPSIWWSRCRARPTARSAEFCFDDATGVLRSVEVVRDEAIDRTEAVEIRTEVTDADLRPDDLGEPVVTG